MPGRSRKPASKHKPDRMLWLIAIFKLFKGLLLLSLGIGALSLLHKNVAEAVTHWADLLRIDTDNHFIHKLLVKSRFVDDRQLERVGAGTFFYAALLLTEGGGLLRQKPWAEYLTVFATASLIPLEIYELLVHFSLTKILVLILNLAVLLYLILRLRHHRKWPFK